MQVRTNRASQLLGSHGLLAGRLARYGRQQGAVAGTERGLRGLGRQVRPGEVRPAATYTPVMATPEEVLRFWFQEPASDAESLHKKMIRWFQGSPALDDDIRAQFGEDVDRAIAGDL